MSKKSLKIQTDKMLVAALFTMLCVGLYAHVDGYVTRKELQNVLGTQNSVVSYEKKTEFPGGFWAKIWCRLKYGPKCEEKVTEMQEKTEVVEESVSTDVLIEKELKNLENELKTDMGEQQNSSYWSM